MTKEKIIKLYIADLNNLVADSDAKRNRIMDLEDELEALKQGQSLTTTGVVKSDSELLPIFLYKSDGGLYFKHRENTDVTQQWNEYLSNCR